MEDDLMAVFYPALLCFIVGISTLPLGIILLFPSYFTIWRVMIEQKRQENKLAKKADCGHYH